MKPENQLTVIALHGIALSAGEIEGTVAPVMENIASPNIRWLFPKAPRRNVTILGGCPALAWYDILAWDRSQMDEDGIEEATALVCKTVKEERERDPFGRRVILMGFSQGGCLALNAGLRLQAEVDGIIALATALPFPDRISPATKQSPPVFFGHGFLDTRVPYSLGRETHRLLASNQYETEWHSYAYGHSTGTRQLRDVSRWLDRRFLGAEAAAVLKPASLGGKYRTPHEA
jgi:phospholipase/carboxylesterase